LSPKAKPKSKEPTPKKKVGRPKKPVRRPHYWPYANEAEMHVASSLSSLLKAHQVASSELKAEIGVMFDYVGYLQDKIEAQLDKEGHPASRKALAAEKETQLQDHPAFLESDETKEGLKSNHA